MKNLIQIQNRKKTLLILMDNIKQALRFVNVQDMASDMKKELIRLQGELDALEWILTDNDHSKINDIDEEDFSYF